MTQQVEVLRLPPCDICTAENRIVIRPADYDGRLKGQTAWAYMCEAHWRTHGIGNLGTGYGQKLVLKEKKEEPVAKPLTREELTYVLDREAWDRSWSTLSEAIELQDRRRRSRRYAKRLHDQGFTTYRDESTPILVPLSITWKDDE